MEKLSVLIPTHNNEKIIGQCLGSVKWADEIVIIDSLSTDHTVDICKTYTSKVFAQSFLGYAAQKNWGLTYCSFDWVLQLDSDEQLEAGSEQEIKQVLNLHDNEIQAYQLARKNHVLGQWVRGAGLYPDYQTRLFRKTVGQFKARAVHERLVVPGKVGTLNHHLLHQGMPRISKQLANLDRYTSYEAEELHKNGKQFHWHQLLLRPPAVFTYRYFWQLGILAGYRGLILAVYLAFYSFLTYTKLWEVEELGLEDNP